MGRRVQAGFVGAVRLERDRVPDFDRYPFDVAAVRHLQRLELHPEVTFFVGENGIGKSTLVEAIARKLRFNAEGGSRNADFATRDTHSELDNFLVVERAPRYPTDGYFLRAEAFYNLATYLEGIGQTYGDKSLHEQSHGESFIALMENRLVGDGIYIFDEPEAALSPIRQMSALTLIDRLVRQHSQFIISTHSPILLAYPHAIIYEISSSGIRRTNYTDTEHFQVTRDFLNRHEKMIPLLLDPE